MGFWATPGKNWLAKRRGLGEIFKLFLGGSKFCSSFSLQLGRKRLKRGGGKRDSLGKGVKAPGFFWKIGRKGLFLGESFYTRKWFFTKQGAGGAANILLPSVTVLKRKIPSRRWIFSQRSTGAIFPASPLLPGGYHPKRSRGGGIYLFSERRPRRSTHQTFGSALIKRRGDPHKFPPSKKGRRSLNEAK